MGITKAGVGGRAAVSRVCRTALARNRGDNAVDVHLANSLVIVVSNIHVAVDIERHAGRMEAGAGGRVAIPRVAIATIACHRGDDAVGIHLADATVSPIGNEHVAESIGDHVLGLYQAGVGGRAAISAVGCVAKVSNEHVA